MRENDDRTFAKSPILVENVTGDEVVFRSLGTGKSTSEIFGNLLGNLRTSSDIFGHLRILSVPCEKSWHSQDKNVTPMNHKKLADIQDSVLKIHVQFLNLFSSFKIWCRNHLDLRSQVSWQKYILKFTSSWLHDRKGTISYKLNYKGWRFCISWVLQNYKLTSRATTDGFAAYLFGDITVVIFFLEL